MPDFENGGSGARAAASNGAFAVSESLRLVGRTLADVERDLIIETLEHCAGNRTRAAMILGISIRTLRNKLREYSGAGIDIPEPQTQRGATRCA